MVLLDYLLTGYYEFAPHKVQLSHIIDTGNCFLEDFDIVNYLEFEVPLIFSLRKKCKFLTISRKVGILFKNYSGNSLLNLSEQRL